MISKQLIIFRIEKRQMDPMDYLKQYLIEPLDFSKDELRYFIIIQAFCKRFLAISLRKNRPVH